MTKSVSISKIQQIERVNHTKSLGVTIDDRLSWSNYINEVCKKQYVL